jgi:uncharacterized tellurite resistance protein B-like protein
MTDSRKLLKILIGVAWIDGQIQDAERDYLLQIAQEKGLASDPEISALLNNLGVVAVKPADCHAWIKDYLGDHPSPANYQQLLEALSSIVYSDDDVAIAEAQLLMELQQPDSPQQLQGGLSVGRALLSRLRTVYRRLARS